MAMAIATRRRRRQDQVSDGRADPDPSLGGTVLGDEQGRQTEMGVDQPPPPIVVNGPRVGGGGPEGPRGADAGRDLALEEGIEVAHQERRRRGRRREGVGGGQARQGHGVGGRRVGAVGHPQLEGDVRVEPAGFGPHHHAEFLPEGFPVEGPREVAPQVLDDEGLGGCGFGAGDQPVRARSLGGDPIDHGVVEDDAARQKSRHRRLGTRQLFHVAPQDVSVLGHVVRVDDADFGGTGSAATGPRREGHEDVVQVPHGSRRCARQSRLRDANPDDQWFVVVVVVQFRAQVQNVPLSLGASEGPGTPAGNPRGFDSSVVVDGIDLVGSLGRRRRRRRTQTTRRFVAVRYRFRFRFRFRFRGVLPAVIEKAPSTGLDDRGVVARGDQGRNQDGSKEPPGSDAHRVDGGVRRRRRFVVFGRRGGGGEEQQRRRRCRCRCRRNHSVCV
mmetsp:Transcript_21126/g.44407  ORF Transcript_21126/g.44407 Transcript_21126/m.44407 type:complete len:443 (-) Transcript_21126:182-1510(-)